jgi:hypothetical protein
MLMRSSTISVLLVALAVNCYGSEDTPKPQPPPAPASVGEVDKLRASLDALAEQGEKQIQAGRLAFERAGSGLDTLALYDQMANNLRENNAVGADATFRADITLASKGQTIYRSLRVLFIEDIPRARKQLADAERAAEEQRMASDPAYREQVMREQEAAAAKAKTDVAKHDHEVKTLAEIATGTSIPESHPLSTLISGFRTEYKAQLEQELAPPHKRLNDTQLYQFRQERIKAIQSLPAIQGRTSWGIPSTGWSLSYRRMSNAIREQRYQLTFDIAPTKWPLRWVTCPGFSPGATSEVLGNTDWNGYIGGVLLTGSTPSVGTMSDQRWWGVLRAPSFNEKAMMGINFVFDPAGNDLLASLRPSKDEDGMLVVTVDASYQWNPELHTSSGIINGPQPPRIVASNAKLVSLQHIKRDGTAIALHGTP